MTHVSALKNFAKLLDSDQSMVKELAETILLVWPRPSMLNEQKLLFIDDMARVYKSFGFPVVESPIDWLRQNAQHRPTIKEIRDACAASASSRQPARSLPAEEYYAQQKEHPELYIPVALMVRDIQNLTALKRSRERMAIP